MTYANVSRSGNVSSINWVAVDELSWRFCRCLEETVVVVFVVVVVGTVLDVENVWRWGEAAINDDDIVEEEEDDDDDWLGNVPRFKVGFEICDDDDEIIDNTSELSVAIAAAVVVVVFVAKLWVRSTPCSGNCSSLICDWCSCVLVIC